MVDFSANTVDISGQIAIEITRVILSVLFGWYIMHPRVQKLTGQIVRVGKLGGWLFGISGYHVKGLD